MCDFLSEQAVDGIAVRLTGVALVVEDDRHALVGRLEYGLGFRNHAEQTDGEDFLDVLGDFWSLNTKKTVSINSETNKDNYIRVPY